MKLSELLVGGTAASVTLVLGLGTWARMTATSERSRRAAALEERLWAARTLLSREARDDGYRLAELLPNVELPDPPAGGLRFAFIDDAAETRVTGAAAGEQELGVARADGFAEGDEVVVAGSGGACVAHVEEVIDEGPGRRALVLDDPTCRGAVGDVVARLSVKRYWVEDGALHVDQGEGTPPRRLLEGIVSIALEPAPGEAGEAGLYVLSIEGRDGDVVRRVEALVHPKNRTRGGRQ